MGNRETPLLDGSGESGPVMITEAGFRASIARNLWYNHPFRILGALSAVIVVLGLFAVLILHTEHRPRPRSGPRQRPRSLPDGGTRPETRCDGLSRVDQGPGWI